MDDGGVNHKRYRSDLTVAAIHWAVSSAGVFPMSQTHLNVVTPEIIEKLAAHEHEQWAHWTRYMLDNLSKLGF